MIKFGLHQTYYVAIMMLICVLFTFYFELLYNNIIIVYE